MEFKRPTKEEAKQLIQQLVDKFEKNKKEYINKDYDETSARVEFIDKFFKALGWDISNERAVPNNIKEVVREENLSTKDGTKHPDYSFTTRGNIVFYVEAKKPSVNLKDDKSPALQLRRYGWNRKLAVSILTDFEEFAIYDVSKPPKAKDTAVTGRIKFITYDKYIENFDFIYDTFSWFAVNDTGKFDEYVSSFKIKGTEEIDSKLLDTITDWRQELARRISLDNGGLDIKELNIAVQKIIDRLLFLRIAEDKQIEQYGDLLSLIDKDDIYKQLIKLFNKANDKYNSGLFEKIDWLDNLYIDDNVLHDIIKSMYVDGDCPYEWSILPIEILGNIYEKFLGSEIVLKGVRDGKTTAIIEEKPEVKKAGGVYYTPKYIVDYIVKETVGKKLENATIKQADDLKILDMACGSGSFLIGAYKYLLDWYFEQYNKDVNKYLKTKVLVKTNNGIQLSIKEKKRILVNNIYGVDIDYQAVEVTKLSLFLQMLDKQGREVDKAGTQSMFLLTDGTVLPNMSNNIKCGNSLVGTDIYTQNLTTEFDDSERERINAFNYNDEFYDIMSSGGFDVIIGNPPYIGAETMTSLMLKEREYCQRQYISAKGNWDIYICFIDKSMNLLNKKGLMSYITPDKWITKPFGDGIRENYIEKISQIVNAGRKVFQDAKIDSIITIFDNETTKTIDVKVYNEKSKSFLSEREVEKQFIKPPYQLDIVFSDKIYLINKLENVKDKLSDYYNCENACATSDCYKLKEVLKSLKYEEEYDTNKYYKVINTGTIAPFVCKWGKQEMTYLKDKYLLPVVRIKQFELLFKNSYASKTKQKKIIIKGLTHLDGCIDFIGNVIPGKTTLLITAKDDDELKLICAYINSKVAFFYIKEKYSSYSYNGGINFQYKMINDLPWVNLSSEDKNKVLQYVDYIISHQENDNRNIIDAIDNIYYNYFDLSTEEKKIINSSK